MTLLPCCRCKIMRCKLVELDLAIRAVSTLCYKYPIVWFLMYNMCIYVHPSNEHIPQDTTNEPQSYKVSCLCAITTDHRLQ